MTDPISPSTLARIAASVAREAGAIVLRRPRAETVRSKTVARDLVSEIDRRAEALIRKRLRTRTPRIPVIGEEGEQDQKADGPCWYVDPVDGTVNHVHGVPHYSLSVACADGDRVIAGAIYDPVRKEMFTASRGGGAFLNGKRIHVSKTADLTAALLGTGFPYDRTGPDNNVARFTRLMIICHGVRRLGSACLDLAYVACGRFDGYWEQSLQPWDFAAGSLLVQEAGGTVTAMQGAALTIGPGSVFASNGILHAAIAEKLAD